MASKHPRKRPSGGKAKGNLNNKRKPSPSQSRKNATRQRRRANAAVRAYQNVSNRPT